MDKGEVAEVRSPAEAGADRGGVGGALRMKPRLREKRDRAVAFDLMNARRDRREDEEGGLVPRDLDAADLAESPNHALPLALDVLSREIGLSVPGAVDREEGEPTDEGVRPDVVVRVGPLATPTVYERDRTAPRVVEERPNPIRLGRLH